MGVGLGAENWELGAGSWELGLGGVWEGLGTGGAGGWRGFRA